ncbi:MAG: helix-turn-helix domain-containing GNAT family N-acetyltransferase [Candidatus Zixiibacteriota bacterium]
MDILGQLGPLGFASRLRRLGERLQRDASLIYKAQSIDFEGRWFPVLYVLKDRSYLSVTAIAAAIGLTHPAVNQIAEKMASHGLISSLKDSDDERRRLIVLTDKGVALAGTLQPIWRDIEAATREIVSIKSSDAIEALNRIERSLDEKSMLDRVMSRTRKRQFDSVTIVDYRPNYKRYFKSLNYEWLKEHFEIEQQDEKILSDPNGEIIKNGGAVIFALLDGEVVGTAALIKRSKTIFELSKMAVVEVARRKQVGRKLVLDIISRAKNAGAKSLILFTSPKLLAAIALYRSVGFGLTEDPGVPLPKYKRKTIAMRLTITKKT